ncbi:MAG: hypothetical protein KDK04_03400 [Candidatus Competibacteraceae bacterium]|nr:hypothetical protein [Candidatus Competibacteraceae bacterium]MCB1810757.1 hypothetical protein [Candidatus Competibacteraceae bacterium]
MSDQAPCTEACKIAYTGAVANCYSKLNDALAIATTKTERDKARDRFAKCLKLCQDTYTICCEECQKLQGEGG